MERKAQCPAISGTGELPLGEIRGRGEAPLKLGGRRRSQSTRSLPFALDCCAASFSHLGAPGKSELPWTASDAGNPARTELQKQLQQTEQVVAV